MSVVSLVVVVTHHFVRIPDRVSFARTAFAVITIALLIRRQRALAAVGAQVAVVRLLRCRRNGRSDASDAPLALAAILGRVVP